MSITNPRNSTELKDYILHRLGAPVLEINVSDEQLDIAINDAFAYYFGRSHYNGTERVFLGLRVEQPFVEWWDTKQLESVEQGKGRDPVVVSEDGMVDTITLTAAGSGYPPTTGSKKGTLIDVATTTSGSGSGLTLDLGTGRTTSGGLTTATVNRTGSGYSVGDTITVSGGDGNATFEVATIKTSSPVYGNAVFEFQNNYIVLPDNVLSVSQVMKKSGFGAVGGAIPGVAFFNPFLVGGMNGQGACGSMSYDLTSYYTMQQYLATLDFMIFPPISYNYNQRTHRLFLNTDSFNGVGVDDYLLFEVTTYPEPEKFPEMYSDFWFKEYVVSLVKYQWGQNLSKYNSVSLPGGITLNGEGIKQEAKEELGRMRDRFAMDAADPPLDLVG